MTDAAARADVVSRREAILREGFTLARAHPFYRDMLQNVRDHADAPASDKHALRQALADFAPGAEASGVYLVRSGGSTQEPLIFPVDIGENRAQRRALAERLRAAGVFDAGTVALNIFGYSDLYRSAAILDDLLERCEATTLPMSAHARYEDMYAIASRFRPTHILGTPSKLQLFARFLADEALEMDIPQLLYAGEPLRVSALDLLRARLRIRQVWSLYGGAETGILGWCDGNLRPDWFRLLPGIVVEILSPDERGFGPIAITNGYRKRFPVFRYRLGDVGRLIDENGVQYLELRGRDNRSFQFDEMTYDLELFAPLTVDVDAFQIQLRTRAGGRDHLSLLLVTDSRRREVEPARRFAPPCERLRGVHRAVRGQ